MDFSWTFPYPSQRMPVFADNVVATSQPLAAQAGLNMLRKGGNAVDAALAAAITLTVVEPTMNGIGGDAFAIVWDGNRLHGLNGSGKSPAAMSFEQFAGQPSMPELGWEAVTVPGAVDAWITLSRQFGRLPFADLFEPAIQYARDGYAVSPITAGRWREAEDRYKDFPDFGRIFLPNGRAPQTGSLFQSPAHAGTLEQIAATQAESFYRGKLAEQILAYSASTGGYFSEQDLAGHRSEWVEPVSTAYAGIDLHEIPPNGQGMIALIALGILRHLDISRYPVDSADSIHLQIEAMKIAFAEANRHIADPASMEIAPHQLLVDDFLQARAADIQMKKAQFPQATLPATLPVDKGTVYLTTADRSGMMVSYIQSNYWGFGSGIVDPQTGISFQNRGCGFNLQKEHPNCFAGGKRPFHTIIPGFITRQQKPLMSFGVMGGHMQPQGHVQMVVRMFSYGQNPQSASDAPRWHVGNDHVVALENNHDPSIMEDLKLRGHPVTMDVPAALFGGAQLIARMDNGYCAASDHRKDGQAVGF
jgi:gamma-glutamyltranspeptidase/glutathione hydrolase